MKNFKLSKKLLFLFVLCLVGIPTSAQNCQNASRFPSASITPISNGAVTNISTCNFLQEHSEITGVISGYEYEFTCIANSNSGYITVREGSVDGPVIGNGFSPLNVTTTSSANLFVHWNTNDTCGTSSSCYTTTVACIDCATIPDCEGVPGGSAIPGSACDDGDSNTVNDVYDENCICAGIVVDPGNACEAAIALDCSTGPTTFSSVGSIATNNTSCSMGSNGLWFSFEGTGADITVNTSATFDIEMSVNTGACGALVSLSCRDQYGSSGTETYTIVNSVLNQMYYVYVADWSSSGTNTGDITIAIDCAVVPNCTAPALTLEVQDDVGAPIVDCLEAGGEFYVLASLSGGDGNTSYNVSANGGTPIEVTADSSEVFGPFPVGANVSVNALGVQDDLCSVSESINLPVCPPVNNTCANAIALSCGDSVTGTTISATESGVGSPSCSGGSMQDVFYALDVLEGHEYSITVNGADFDGVLMLYTGTCGSLVELYCADNGFSAGIEESITFTAAATETIIIRTYDWSTTQGSFTITNADVSAPIITCPANETVPGPFTLPDYFGEALVTAIDNCTDPVVITTQDPAPGTELPDGIHTITLTAEDDYGNIATCTFDLDVDDALSIVEQELDSNKIDLYPNPTNHSITIENQSTISLQKLDVYDITGRLVKTIDLDKQATQFTIDLSNLPAATYFIKIISNQGSLVKKLIKQ